MQSFFLRTWCVISFCVLLASCGSDDSEGGPGGADVDVTFLKVGTKYTFYYDDGFFNIDSLYTHVEKQLAPDTFLVRYSSESIVVSPTQYWVLKDKALYTSLRVRDPDAYTLECKFGEPAGTTWTSKKNGITLNYKIEAINVSLKTGDGEVKDAVKVKTTRPGSSGEAYNYFSPTVGLLGTGAVDAETVNKLVHYTVGTTNTTVGNLPAITFGSFPFMTVGKYWNYVEEDFVGNIIELKLSIESKLPNKNIYKVKADYDGDVSYSYWYEDNGFLMVYEEDEVVVNADPIYMDESKATVGYGWGGLTGNGTMFIYTIEAKGVTLDTYFGELSCLEIGVSDGFFGYQSNYWTKNKGNVLVSGFTSRDLESSNARKGVKNLTILPVL